MKIIERGLVKFHSDSWPEVRVIKLIFGEIGVKKKRYFEMIGNV
jgi:hypothetical protein